MSHKKLLPFKNYKKSKIGKNIKYRGSKHLLKQLQEEGAEYLFMINQITNKPLKKICDITGLPSNYTCPRTNLNYYNGEVYEYIRNIRPEIVQQYLDIKNSGKEMKMFKKTF
ncbi:YL1 nuclear domain-containing protein [Hamiltosporidium tvaerminnensis]|uniref:YL1 nuclear domain-containing protein n=2 Tax=Hamiltosporidium TaxID=1176354 RepID=A0A4Q9KVB6_9MICR|nr:YL1 nuclear domain-containing protein [Hamiltosporidium tvaerminnensis]TBT98837.1 YL1 nuclear domain-containing protein [Hamiltosporidium magnivora]TBU07252.1 YL1 nuclear domain-containing protein [Hamiltosporidium magnivora]TBU10410.1 YL1 nuclear domain-containing protein [Hamiltosporidium tvaerminnensis]TBU13614.1 YL1 nuclear domain-containing protein [Hamiltosporidium tvaerminnensis]